MTVDKFAAKTREREERIGIHFSLVDAYLAQKRDTTAVLERPVVWLKLLYSDFVVRELSPLYNNCEPLVLEPMSTGVCENSGAGRREKRVREEEKNEESVVGQSEQSTDMTCTKGENLLIEVEQKFLSLLNSEDLALLLTSLREDAKKITLCGSMTKSLRTEVHQAVKDTLGASHISRTVDGAFVIEKATPAKRRESIRRSNPLRSRKFLHFTLYKENMDSNRALRAVATCLGVPLKALLVSGTKDKRAVTLQRVALLGLTPEKLSGVNNKFFGPKSKVKVCGAQEMDVGLRLGDSAGNHFLIALRLMPESPVFSLEMVQTIKDVIGGIGVVNYYGSQRFGTTEVLTSDVGIKLVAGNFEEALRMIFYSKSIVEPDLVDVWEAFERRAYEKALELLPHYCFQEQDILKHLIKSPNDFFGALQSMPRTLCMLYFHALQSLTWNIMASKRMAQCFDKPLPGDLVLKSCYDYKKNEGFGQNCGNSPNDAAFFMKEDGLSEVTRLTAEDVATGHFDITDVLLPVPGPDEELEYPDVSACSRDAYMATLTLLGAEELVNARSRNVNLFHYHGAYRPLIVRPRKLNIRLVSISDLRDPIIPTDLEILMKGEKPSLQALNHEVVGDSCTVELPHKAILVDFSLPPGSYATSVLREFVVCCSEGDNAKSS